MDLSGKVAFISGGGGGIGTGIAQALAECGMKTVLADIEFDLAEAAARNIGGGALAVALDVTSPASWAEARDAAVARLGPVDLLCNNAGISHPRMALDAMDDDLFARVMAINVTGVFNGIIAFAPTMKARRQGHIVNTSSVNGLLPFGTFSAYSASKFAVLGLSDGLRDELAEFGVGVSTLFPGLTRSRMSTNGDFEVPEANMMDPLWLGRAVARAVVANDRYIITHPGHLPALEARHAEILAAFGEPAQPGYLVGAISTGASPPVIE